MGELLSYDPEERQAAHVVTTIDNGIEYEGTGIYSCGKLIDVEDIEVVTKIDPKPFVDEFMNNIYSICGFNPPKQ